MTKLSKIDILDGGFGRELQARGVSIDTPLWSAWAFYYAPDIIEEIHRDFVDAGANIITSNTYALTRHHLEKVNKLGEHELLLDQAYQIIQKSVDGSKNARIAASLPPLVESYRPDLVKDITEMDEEYSFLVKKAVEYEVDIILGETLATIKEAESVLKHAAAYKIPVWISFTVNEDGNLRSGECLKNAASVAIEKGAEAVLVNCSSVSSVDKSMALLSEVSKKTPLRYGAYPNRFHEIRLDFTLASGLNTIDQGVSIDDFVDYSQKWVDEGAAIIGGCCGMGVDFIKALSDLK